MAPNDKQWACEQIETRLSDYLDRLLTAAERGGFEEHVAGCARCAPLVHSVGGLVNGMHRLEPLEAPPRLVYNILDRTLGARTEKKGWRAWMGWLQPIWQPRFAYGAVSVLVTAARAFPGPGLPMAQADAGGSEPGEHVPGGRSPRPHHLRPRHEVCHRPARGIRDSVAPATRGRTAAGARAEARPRPVEWAAAKSAPPAQPGQR